MTVRKTSSNLLTKGSSRTSPFLMNLSSEALKALARISHMHCLLPLQQLTLKTPSPHDHTLTLMNPHTNLPLSWFKYLAPNLLSHQCLPPFSSSSYSSITSSSPSPTSSVGIIIVSRCIEELHFDVPLISTRLSHKSTHHSDPNPNPNQNQAYSTGTSRSIPFLWERAPGVPKDSTPRDAAAAEGEVFTPRPPPGRWWPPNLNESTTHDAADSYFTGDDASDVTDLFSDALGRISLSESQGMPCRVSVSKDAGPGVTRAPSFIMNRFLPAANALAASTAAAATPKYWNRTRARSGGSRDPSKLGRARHSSTTEATSKIGACQHHADASPTKACGIMLLFPWSMKSAVCGLDRPIRCQTPNTTSLEEFKAQRSKKKGTSGLGMSSDDGLSSRARKSPWGLPFSDTSRVPRRNEKKSRGFVGVERESPRRNDGHRGGVSAIGSPLSVPKTPIDPWLANALISVNRRRRRRSH